MAVERARPRVPPVPRCRVARVRPVAPPVGASRGSDGGASVATGEGTVGGGAIPGGADVGRGDGGAAVAGTVQGARTLCPPKW